MFLAYGKHGIFQQVDIYVFPSSRDFCSVVCASECISLQVWIISGGFHLSLLLIRFDTVMVTHIKERVLLSSEIQRSSFLGLLTAFSTYRAGKADPYSFIK